MFTISIKPRHLLMVLLGIMAALIAVSYLFMIVTVALGVDAAIVVSARKFFNIDAETNLPSWYSSTLLAVAGLSALEVGRQKLVDRATWGWHWAVIGLGFLYLSLDELVSLHEELPVDWVPAVGPLKYAWVVIALPLALAAGLFYIRFLLAQPRRITRLLVLAAFFYLFGAAGFEMIGSTLSSAGVDEAGMLYGTSQHIEEAFEMTGVSILLYVIALVQQSRRTAPDVVELPRDQESTAPASRA